MMCVVPWAWYQICRARFPAWEKLGFWFFDAWCDVHRLAVSRGDPCTAALSLPTSKVAAIGFQEQANEAGGVWNGEYGKTRKGMERVQVKLLSKLFLGCTIQFSWPLLTDSPQFFSPGFLPLFVHSKYTFLSSLEISQQVVKFHFPALSGVTHDSRWSQTPGNEQDSTGPSDSKKHLLLGFDKSCGSVQTPT